MYMCVCVTDSFVLIYIESPGGITVQDELAKWLLVKVYTARSIFQSPYSSDSASPFWLRGRRHSLPCLLRFVNFGGEPDSNEVFPLLVTDWCPG